MATALAKNYDTTLYYCFEKEGVLRDLNDANSLISTINKEEFETLKKEGVIADGMIPKLENSFNAINNGVKEVVILHAKNLLNKHGTVLIR
ncbi:MAG: Acetylglutamate kinase [Bacteroidetes bacterium ADurb.BinA174]|nr:MAG: Acetylglutamate kinase [Bacteroidetes bacterium ADurb.BinA174]